jgi:tungstate transport system substrate-binding protein
MKMKKQPILFFLCLILCVLGLSWSVRAQESRYILMASTIGPIDSGIIGLLEDHFEKDSAIRVRHVGAGTGAALDLAKGGSFDIVLVHAKSLEEKFIAEGYGTERIPLMYNDFVIIGPANDPARIKGIKTAAEALSKIAAAGSLFISRGDRSGTHVAEMGLWEKAGIKPSGSWYSVYEKGSTGNVTTLKYTSEKQAYTVIDRATYLAVQKEIKLSVLVENDDAMLNYISVIPVNPAKFSRINHADTMVFVKWLTAPEKGQAIIRDFGKEKYSGPLFFPNSTEWKQAQGLK